MEEKTLATELLHELKASSVRWFYAFIVVLCLWFATIAAFIIYLSLPIDEVTTEVTQDSEGDNNMMIGVGDYGTTNSEGYTETP